MIVGSRQRLQQVSDDSLVKIGDHVIQKVPIKKTLDIIIEEELKWQKHVDAQCKKISKNEQKSSLHKTYY